MVAPLQPCSWRFSAPFVEKTSMNWSKSSTCVVASSISISFVVVFRRAVGLVSGGDGRAEVALLRIDRPEALDDLETAAARTGDVHVHAHVVLAWDHRGRAARALRDLRVIQGRDHVCLLERAGLLHGGGPKPQPAVEARAPAPAGELRVTGVEGVVLREQL